MVLIGRPVNEITLNGLEFLLDEHQSPIRFSSEAEAKNFLTSYGYTTKDIENEGIVFVEDDIPKTLWRNDENSAVRNATDVIAFEMCELGNTDIPYTVYHRYIEPNLTLLHKSCADAVDRIKFIADADSAFDLCEGTEAFLATAQDILRIIKMVTGVTVRYALWLAPKKSVVDLYHGTEENMAEYPTSPIILSDLGKEGFLFGYEDYPIANKQKEKKEK